MAASLHCSVEQQNVPVMRDNGSSRTELPYCQNDDVTVG